MTPSDKPPNLFLWATGGVITQDQADAAADLFDRLLPGFAGPGLTGPISQVEINDHGDAIVFTYAPFFGPGHLQGNWPLIVAAIRIMQRCFPHSAISYGDQYLRYSSQRAVPPITELMDDDWKLWLDTAANGFGIPDIGCGSRSPRRQEG